MKKLTRVLEFIIDYKVANNGNSPTYRAIRDAVGYKSICAIGPALEKLKRLGLIKYHQNKASHIEVVGGKWIPPFLAETLAQTLGKQLHIDLPLKRALKPYWEVHLWHETEQHWTAIRLDDKVTEICTEDNAIRHLATAELHHQGDRLRLVKYTPELIFDGRGSTTEQSGAAPKVARSR